MNRLRPVGLRDILQPQAGGTHHTDYTTYYSDDSRTREIKLELEKGGNKVTIIAEDRSYSIERGDMSEKKWVESLGRVRHDWVAEEGLGGTDVPLSEIGVDIGLTPDCIDKRSRRVLELSTVGTSERYPVERAHLSKVVAYGDILDQANIPYFILVVTPDTVLFNGTLTQEIVNMLCARCREGMNLEKQMRPLIGELFPNELPGDEEFAEVEWAMREMSAQDAGECKSYKKTLIQDSARKNTDLENEIVMNMLEKTFQESSKKQVEPGLDKFLNYQKEMSDKGTRSDQKRVINFPLLRVARTMYDVWRHEKKYLELGTNKDVPPELYNAASQALAAWQQKLHRDSHEVELTSMIEARTGIPDTPKHNMRKMSEVTLDLTPTEKLKIALSGPGAKEFSSTKELAAKEAHGKLGFDPSTSTLDIEEFLTDGYSKKARICSPRSVSWDLTMKAKSRIEEDSLSSKLVNSLREEPMIEFCEWVAEAVTEISYEYKVPHRNDRWSFKGLPNYPVFMLIKCTGTHTFVSYIVDKSKSCIDDLGRIGPTIWETEKFYISDWCSYMEVTLEHFAPIEEYMIGMGCHLVKHFHTPISKIGGDLPEKLSKTWRWLLLMYLNDKHDVEEMVTSSRFLYMKVMQYKENSPYRFVDRLPEVLRSRLSVLMLKELGNLMAFYDTRKPFKRRVRMNVKSV
jgi:hypothetical protein